MVQKTKSVKNRKIPWKMLLLLHISLFFSSLSGVCSKMAANQKFLSLSFFFYYGLVLAIMFAYAIVWQQILKRMPLTVAYANKPVALVWGMIFGSVFFAEKVTLLMVLGAGIIFAGIFLVVSENE